MKLIKILFIWIFVGLVGLLGYATFVEQAHGPLFVAESIYHTWWFFALWACLAVLSVIIITQQKLWKRTAVFMLHISFLVILAGAAVTFITGNEGIVHLRKGIPDNEYIVNGTGQIKRLPFKKIELESFHIDYYPGTQAPQDFISQVNFYPEGGQKQTATISMNNIFQYQGYRFYQSSFDSDQQGTVLSVSYDPWGTPLTYFGYCMLAFSMFLVLFNRNEEFRRLLRNPVLRKSTLIFLAIFALTANNLSARSIPTINEEKAEKLARMPIIYNDRVVEVSESRISAEILYNNLPFAKILFMANLTMGLLTFLLMMMPRRTTFYVLLRIATCLLWLSFLFLCFGYGLRWFIGGRIPLGNGYETMLFLALSIMAFTLLMHRRFTYLIPFGFLLSGFTLLVAWLGEMNPQITPLMPVLKSPLLSTHVSVIMMSYALLAFMVLNGIMALIQSHRGNHQQVEQLTLLSRLMLYPAVFFLAAGIFLGAVWANVSWGKYWSWDPKEVWALITMMIYAVPFHHESQHFLRQPKWFHLYLILAFFTVLMTYFGVNYFLGGMHSYA